MPGRPSWPSWVRPPGNFKIVLGIFILKRKKRIAKVKLSVLGNFEMLQIPPGKFARDSKILKVCFFSWIEKLILFLSQV